MKEKEILKLAIICIDFKNIINERLTPKHTYCITLLHLMLKIDEHMYQKVLKGEGKLTTTLYVFLTKKMNVYEVNSNKECTLL
jgi:hypothetical protein